MPRRLLASGFALSVLCLLSINGCPPSDGATDDTPAPSNSNSNANANANDNTGRGGSATSPRAEPIVADAPPAAPDEPAPPPMLAATALLNEIRFLPRDGESAFAELKAPTGASLANLKLVNEAGGEFVVPNGAKTDDAGIAIVVFDGRTVVNEDTISAAPADFLNPVSGSLTLLDVAGAALDRIAWGPEQAEAARLSTGGGAGPEDPTVGMTIGRYPQSLVIGWEGWTSFAPPQATPGLPNPNPGAAVLLPLSGFTVEAGEVQLSWYPVENADTYKLQVATDADFASVVIDVMTDTSVTTQTLAEGTYHWRVQAIDADGIAADWSPVNVLYVATVVDTSATDDADTSKPRGRAQGRGMVTRVNLDAHAPGGAFPSISQRKDSPLLLLESDKTAAGHAWDGPHVTCDTNDPADKMNCTLASTQMINHFYGGDLTQDRIGYDAHHADAAGPETDLNFNEGNWPDKPLRFALGAPVGYTTPAVYSYASLWTALTGAIDDDRPMLLVIVAGAGTHSIAAHGYEIDTTVVPHKYSIIVNDPWNHGGASARRGPMEFYALANRLVRIYIVPKGVAGKKQEKEVTTDTDNDGVFDFDEKSRFGTLWDGRAVGDVPSQDSDKDCLHDKIDIQRSVLDEKHGYAIKLNQKKGDGKARGNPPGNASPGGRRPELLMDTDGGGLPDGVEDWNLDGKAQTDKGESDPYERSDDPRKITGTRLRTKDRDDPPNHNVQTIKTEYTLQTAAGGKLTGRVKFTYNARYEFQASSAPPQCPEPREIVWQFNEVMGEAEVEGEFVCFGEKGLAIFLRDKGEPFRASASGIQTDPCLGGGPVTESELIHSGAGQFFPEMTDALGVVSNAFFPTMNRVQWKTKHRYSSLPTERNFILEWDLVMTPR
ncbi:hypothetical protein RAS1_02730 [Phycisphaerae bacterium RAS1]|nr:hypothetical protein RAS1_02730 [Phycisphaerae bacterium RAS1]